MTASTKRETPKRHRHDAEFIAEDGERLFGVDIFWCRSCGAIGRQAYVYNVPRKHIGWRNPAAATSAKGKETR